MRVEKKIPLLPVPEGLFKEPLEAGRSVDVPSIGLRIRQRGAFTYKTPDDRGSFERAKTAGVKR